MTNEATLKRFPTIQAKMGDWDYYVTTLPFYEVEQRVKFATDLITPANMSEWIQRNVITRRAEQIADYLINQPERFFSGIVVGVYRGQPTWHEIEVQESPIWGTPGLDPRFRNSFGILELDGEEKLYAIDGQHRVAGIKKALEQLKNQDDPQYETLANEDLTFVFVSAEIGDGKIERVRRLFTTLNKEARRVNTQEIIALDEDDPAAIITRWLAIHYDGLKKETPKVDGKPAKSLIHFAANQIPKVNRHSVTSIVTLHALVKKVFKPELDWLKKEYSTNRPSDEDLKALYIKAVGIWESARQYVSSLDDVLGSNPEEERASKYRGEHGGQILFRPVGLQAFAGALGRLRSEDVDLETAIRSLCEVPMEISEPPWNYVVWNPNTKRMISQKQNIAVAEDIFLHMSGYEPKGNRSDLRTRYNNLFDDPSTDPFKSLTTSRA